MSVGLRGSNRSSVGSDSGGGASQGSAFLREEGISKDLEKGFTIEGEAMFGTISILGASKKVSVDLVSTSGGEHTSEASTGKCGANTREEAAIFTHIALQFVFEEFFR
tara:strand:- start:711 stop:1034 length:324 start_codon:yes stop_codon:yes gene_type:complete